MKELLIYAAGVVVCSGFFTLFYRFALHGRISFRVARVFLIASLAAAIAIPALRIPVWKPAQPVNLTIDWQTVGIVAEAPVAVKKRDIRPLAIWSVYGCGVAAMLFVMLRQTAAMRRIRRRGKTYPAEGYSLVVSESVASPFSFFSTVYAGADTPPEELRQIIAHELGHIRRRHSAEKMIMEILKTTVWFNPFGWYAARLLNEVHEFEADRDALRGGCEIERYLSTIFRQAFGYVPEISAGLGHSLTKKRFEMMMKNFRHARFSWLRTVGVLPLAAAMLVLFGFTRRAPEIILRTETEAVPVSDTLEQKTVSGYRIDPDKGSGSDQARITVMSSSRTVQDTLEGQIKVIGAGAIRKQGAELGSFSVMRSSSGDKPFVWIAGSNPHELKDGDLNRIDPNSIKSISVFKNKDSYPKEIVEAMGGRDFSGVIIIEPKEVGSKLEKPVENPDKMPAFVGDQAGLMKWLGDNLKYPEEAIKQDISGRVTVRFTVKSDGTIGDTAILQSPHESLSEEVLRLVKAMPDWIPGELNGKPVAVAFNLPVVFNLDDKKPRSE